MFFSKGRKVEVYKTIDGREPFVEWKDQLDVRLKMKVLARLSNLQSGSLGDHRFLGDGISELKFRDGIRVYYSEVKRVIVLLLCGGGKNTKRDQSKDIEKAKEYLQDYKGRMK
jgi:putative addiction module killer protein